MTPDELGSARDFVDRAEDDGYRVVVIPTNIRVKLQGATDITGEPIVDLGRFKEQWNESFSFSFVDPAKLTKAERAGSGKGDPDLEDDATWRGWPRRGGWSLGAR